MSRKFINLADHGLWDDVARSINPLLKSGRPVKQSQKKSALLSQSVIYAYRPPEPKIIATKPKSNTPPPLARFDRKTEQRFTRGKVDIESRIDLHGETVEMARFKLLQYIVAQRAQGVRLVLVITGKGASPFARHTLHGSSHFHAPEREGKLRREFSLWLHEAAFRDHVTGFQPAHPRHGGGGAFYVKLRRNHDLSHDAIW
jgi:DNA-nicking Smr family endonuclease